MKFLPEKEYFYFINFYINYLNVYRETDKPIFVTTFAEPYVHNEEDIYLKLEVLAAILEQLSAESGKIR